MSDNGAVEYRCNPDVAVEVLDGEALIWDDHAQALHRLNPATTAVWQACARWTPIPVVGDLPRAEVERCVRDLAELQLLRRRELPG